MDPMYTDAPDEDELINDAMEEDFPEEPSMPDDEEEAEADHNPGSAIATADAVPPVIATTTSTVPSPQQVRVAFARRPERAATNNVFEFERYDENIQWRGSGNKKNRKQRNAEKPHSERRTLTFSQSSNDDDTYGISKRSTPQAPDAQLLALGADHTVGNFIMNGHKNSRKRAVRLPTSITPGVDRHQAMTLADGTRVWLQCSGGDDNDDRDNANKEGKSNSNSGNDDNGLGISVGKLLKRIEARHCRQRPPLPSAEGLAHDGGRLWVDAYAPTKFAHLLSDERTNRNVLRALRDWDPFVFRRARLPQPEFGPAAHTAPDANNANPKDTRPLLSQRILLLSGPPGVGKTTLAHVMARHAGYRVVEVNASDDRSRGVLQERIVNAMERTILLTTTTTTNDNTQQQKQHRPNCVVLDEIDGADPSAVQAIVKLVQADLRGTDPKLKRPLILICNNRYAPTLRPLWPYCRHFRVHPPRPHRLVERLRTVLAQATSLAVPSSKLYKLVTQTGGDIRSCLHQLQYATTAARHHEETSDEPVDLARHLASVMGKGQKDSRSNLVGLLTFIFRKQKPNLLMDKNDGIEPVVNSTSSILESMESLSESTSKVLEALFENVLQVSYIDPTMDRCAAAHEWMSLAALASRWAPATAGALHLLCRVECAPNLIYTTRVNTDHQYARDTHQQLERRFRLGLSRKAAQSYAARDTIPYSLWILSAGAGLERMAAPRLETMKPKERQAFDAHVRILHSLGLTYTVRSEDEEEHRNAESSKRGRMCLDPPIDTLVAFDDVQLDPSDMRQEIPDSMKELLAQRALYEKLRGGSGPSSNPTTVPPTQSSAVPAAKTEQPMKVTPEPPKRTAPVATTGSGTFQRPKPTAQNFLGGLRKKRQASARAASGTPRKAKRSHTGSQTPLAQVVRLKYLKGFTQAVRAPCKLADLE